MGKVPWAIRVGSTLIPQVPKSEEPCQAEIREVDLWVWKGGQRNFRWEGPDTLLLALKVETRGPGARERCQPLEARKGGKGFSPGASRKEPSPTDTLISAQWDPCPTVTSRTARWYIWNIWSHKVCLQQFIIEQWIEINPNDLSGPAIFLTSFPSTLPQASLQTAPPAGPCFLSLSYLALLFFIVVATTWRTQTPTRWYLCACSFFVFFCLFVCYCLLSPTRK